MSSVKLSDAELAEGAALTREEFLRLWEASPGVKFAELVRGIVHMPSPLAVEHGDYDGFVGGWLATYSAATPGCRVNHNATWLMEGDETTQPDVSLRVLPEYGGSSRVAGNYLAGAPEFLTEICVPSTSFDLHQKKEVYEEAGVQEYLAVLVKEREVRWHRLHEGKFAIVPLSPDSVHRSVVFPGLWLDVPALLSEDLSRLLATLQKGLGSPEHAAFVAELAARRKL